MRTLHAFPDTNVLLHYQMFDQINWPETLGTDSVELKLPPIIFTELQKRKDSPGVRRIRDRAAAVLQRLDTLLATDLRADVRHKVTLSADATEPSIDFAAHQLDPTIADDRLLASIITFQHANPNESVALITADTGIRLKAIRLSLPAVIPAEKYRLPAELDDDSKRIRALEEELRLLKNAQPRLQMCFADDSSRLSLPLLPPVTLREERILRFRELIQKKYPVLGATDSPTTPSSTHSAGASVSVLSAYLGDASEIPASEISRYNRELATYFSAYEKHIRAAAVRVDRLHLLYPISLKLCNEGSMPAKDVDISLHFPDGLTVLEARRLDRSFRSRRPPRPPIKPRTQTQLIRQAQQAQFASLAQDQNDMWSRIDLSLKDPPVRNPATPRIKRTNSFDVTLTLTDVKHHQCANIAPLLILFDSFADARSFHIDWSAHADNVPDIATGRIDVVIVKPKSY